MRGSTHREETVCCVCVCVCEGYQGHIWVQSFPRSRGIFRSRDHTPQRSRSGTLVHSRHRRCPVHTLGQDGGGDGMGGGVSGHRVVVSAIISLN